MEEPGTRSAQRGRPRTETADQPDLEPRRRRPRIDYARLGLTLGRAESAAAAAVKPAARLTAPRETMPSPPSPPSTSLTQALPPELLVELLERMLVTGGSAQVIGLCGSNREIGRLCQETVINVRALGLPLAQARYRLIDAARALATSARRCVLWAWLLAAQNLIDIETRRGAYTPAQLARLGRRRAQLAQHTDLDRVFYSDLLLWATSRSPEDMPSRARDVIDNERTRPYLWRQLIARAYGVPTGPTPYGMAPYLYADPRDPRSTLVPLGAGAGRGPPLPPWAILLDEVETRRAIGAGWFPADFARMRLDQRQALVQTPEYAARARARIVGALTQALDDTPLAGSDCARRLFDLFDVRVFVAPGTLRVSHYASIRRRPADVWPYDPIDYWAA